MLIAGCHPNFMQPNSFLLRRHWLARWSQLPALSPEIRLLLSWPSNVGLLSRWPIQAYGPTVLNAK